MPSLETLVAAAKPWAAFYSDSKVAQGTLMFAHVAGMLWGGGLAIAADRALLKMRNAMAADRARLLAEVSRLHPSVIGGLALSALSGVLLFAADLETFATSPLYWGKIAAFALLLLNGRWLQVQERRLQKAPEKMAAKWGILSLASTFSITLWFVVTLGGVLLTIS